MSLDQIIRESLKSYNKKTISLNTLENFCSGQVAYPDFSLIIQKLIKEEILTPLKNSKPSIKNPNLHYSYRFYKPLLNKPISEEIQAAQKTHPHLNLSAYYHLSQDQWENDLPYIIQIHDYLVGNKTLPQNQVLRTELSFQLVGDEKWIDEDRGKTILERLGLWKQLQIQKHPEPLMMAVDTSKADHHTNNQGNQNTYFHLVVENKSTYYALLGELPNTMFTTLIYGKGWQITANMNQLEKQLPTLKGTHQVYYFGDLDYEGITIWHKLSQGREVHVATPFYKALLKQKESRGLKNHRKQEAAISQFLKNFPKEKESISHLLDQGRYYPQEAIKEYELRDIFKDYKPGERFEV